MRAVVLLAILFAGCVAPAPSDVEPPAAAAAWNGANTLPLVDADLTVSGVHAGGSTERCVLRCAGQVLTSGAHLVPYDAARVEVLAEWEGGPSRLRFMYDHGASADVVASEIARGEPLIIELEPGMADAPGQKHTHWWWGFHVPDEAGVTPETPVRVSIVAHRSTEAIAPPPIRDVWAEGSANVLVPALPRSNQFVAVPGVGRCIECDGTWWSSAPGGLVALDASRVRATIEWTGDTALTVGAFVPPETYLDLELVEEGASSRAYEIAVDPALADSLDQTKSLWWFFVQTERAAGATNGEFTLTADAVR